jgi:glycosyltransferase involved in cell wall biosynthesis
MIVIDASPAVHHKAGLGRYAEELIAALALPPGAQKPDDRYVAFYHDAANATPSKLIQAMTCIATPQGTYPWRLRALMGQLFNLSQDGLFAHARANTREPLAAPRLFHATEHLLPRFRSIKTVFTLHDLIFRFFPQYHLPRNRAFLSLAMPLFLRRADAIICVSKRTQHDAMEQYGVPEERLRVIYEGVHPRFRRVVDARALQQARERYRLAEKFILAVGTVEPRKNLVTLFEAFKALQEDETPLAQEVIVVGRQGWLHEATYRAVHERGLTGRVRFLTSVDDADLVAIYSLAQVLAFPSEYEGFGLPPLEAMACGTAVVSSNAASLPEMCGNAALLIPPTDAGEWVRALRRVLTDRQVRADLQNRGPAQAAKFTWQKAAQQTLQVYQRVLGNGTRQQP